MFVIPLIARASRRTLRIRPGREGGPPLPSTLNGYRHFLGQLVNRAMFEGMTRLSLGIDLRTKETWMQLYGPYCDEDPRWFDMVPPEAYSYPGLLQACFFLARLDPSLPLKGVIHAVRGRKQLWVELDVHEIRSLQLSWSGDFCDRWRESLTDQNLGEGDRPRGVAAMVGK